MAEEYRFFLRTGVYIAIAGVAYWLLSYEVSGTVLLVALLVAILAFIAVGVALAGAGNVAGDIAAHGGGALAWLNRVIGFGERVDTPSPLEGGPELVPLASPWPIVTAAAFVVIGLGLIFGPWLIVPGVVVLSFGGLGWLTQLDRVS